LLLLVWPSTKQFRANTKEANYELKNKSIHETRSTESALISVPIENKSALSLSLSSLSSLSSLLLSLFLSFLTGAGASASSFSQEVSPGRERGERKGEREKERTLWPPYSERKRKREERKRKREEEEEVETKKKTKSCWEIRCVNRGETIRLMGIQTVRRRQKERETERENNRRVREGFLRPVLWSFNMVYVKK
jgi:hypothetical protein